LDTSDKIRMKERRRVKGGCIPLGLLLLVLISLLVVSATSSSEITRWNSITWDDSPEFMVNITIKEPSKEVEFEVSAEEPFDWEWYVNDEEVETSEGERTNLYYNFDEYGEYNVCVVGERGNETVQACWDVTVSLVIGEENDVRELEGLEDYTLRILNRPERIVSMAPSCTEILFAVGAGDSVVGVTEYCDYPQEVKDKKDIGEIEVIGGYSTPSFEKIVDLEPDLIVGAYGNPDDVIYRLIELGYLVYAQHPKNIEEVFAHIKVTGAITNCNENTASLLNELRNRMEEIEEKTESLEEEQRPRVFYNIGDFFTAGKETFANETFETAGGKNIAAYKSGYFIMSLEELIDKNPQVIICDSGHGGMSIAYDQIVNDERLKDVDAVKNDRVYKIDTNIISRPGPRVVDAVEIVHADYADFFYEMEEEEEENIPPEITSQEPVDTQINNIEGESRTFAISIDQSVDIVWQLNGTEVQRDEDVTEASYTNASAVLGTWNVSVIATNRETSLSDMHAWVWNVTATLSVNVNATTTANVTVTPSSTLVPGVTPAPEAETEIKITPTPLREKPASKEKATPVPATPATPKSKSKPEPPGFEVFFAVIGLLAVMFLLRRNGFKNA
jgi:iron complex transport system substrate-binding protein